MIEHKPTLKKSNIIIGALASNYNKETFDLFFDRINGLSYKNKKLVLVDSSEGNHYYRELLKKGIMAIKVKPKRKNDMKFLAEGYENVRMMLIKSNADYLLMIDENNLPPRDVIQRLMMSRKDVISGCYFINENNDTRLMLMESEDKSNLMNTIKLDSTKGYDFIDGKVKKVFNGGLGCTLISRDVLKEVFFRHVEGINMTPDMFFATDLKAKNIDWFVDTSIMCDRIKPAIAI